MAKKGIDKYFTVEEQKGTIMVLLGIGAVYFATTLIAKKVKDSQEKNYYDGIADPEKASYYAERLFIAMDGWGTDEDEIYAVLSEIPNKQVWKEVQTAYQRQHGEILLKRLVEELDTSEYQKAMTILQQRGLA
jgi:hypothetical protein